MFYNKSSDWKRHYFLLPLSACSDVAVKIRKFKKIDYYLRASLATVEMNKSTFIGTLIWVLKLLVHSFEYLNLYCLHHRNLQQIKNYYFLAGIIKWHKNK